MASRGSIRARTRDPRAAWARWLLVPWSDGTIAAALVAALAAPVFLVAAAGLWRAAAEDTIAAQVVAAAPVERSGIDVQVEAQFDAPAVERADESMRAAFDAVGTVDEPVRTMYTLPGGVASTAADGPIGIPTRLLARPGALDSVTVVERADETTGGVWISSWFADRYGLALGDELAFEAGFVGDEAFNDLVQGGGAADAFTVVAIYEPLWSAVGDPLPPYWSDVAGELVPLYVSAFQAPSVALVLTDEATLSGSGLTGVARWRAQADPLPATIDGLHDVRRAYRRFESSLVQGAGPADDLAGLANASGRRPLLTTELYDLAAEADRSAARLESPIQSARNVGLLIGFATLVAGGAFLVDRRRDEFRLLAGEGERWPRTSARAAVQLAAPATLAVVVGVVGAIVVTSAAGPADGLSSAGSPTAAILLTAIVSVATVAVTTGVLGQRSLGIRSVGSARTARAAGLGVVAGLAIATWFLWLLAGRTTGPTTQVDLVSVALPLVGLVTAVAVVVGVATLVLHALRRLGDRFGMVGFLAWRRLTSGERGLRIVVGALGVGFGLVVFASSLVSTVDRAVDVKLATEIGGVTRLELFGAVPDDAGLPPATTLLRSQNTVGSPGDRRVRVLAVDEATFVDALAWPEEFGLSTAEVAELLAGDATGSLPVVAIEGEPLPDRGAFGSTRPFAYRVVARQASLPTAGRFGSTLMVSAAQLDRFAEARLEESGAADPAIVTPATNSFRVEIVSQLPPGQLEDSIAASGFQVRATTSLSEREGETGVVATRAAYEYVTLLGVVAATAALAALALYLASQRRSRTLGRVMTRTMGMAPSRIAWVAVLEVTTLLVVSLTAAAAAAPLLVDRLARRLDPAPGIPPEVSGTVPWAGLVATSVLLVVGVAAVVFVSDLHAQRRSGGEELRRVG